MNIDLNQYITDATRTESVYHSIKADPCLLAGTIQLMIHAGNILDQIKKNIFYNKPFDQVAFNQQLSGCISAFDLIAENQDLFGQEEVKVEFSVNPRIFHSIVGIATETAELLESINLNSDSIDEVNLLEEYGDINWYQAIGIDEVNGNFNQVFTTNIDKLKLRYPEKFTETDANNRDLLIERDLLTNQLTD